MRRIVPVLATAALTAALVGAPGAATATVPATVPATVHAGDVGATTAPRPPDDPGEGPTIVTRTFASTTGNVRCRRVYNRSDAWVECLLVRTGELVRFGIGGDTVTVRCRAPQSDRTCVLSYGRVRITRATSAQRAAFADARRVPYERTVQLGNTTAPFPRCVVDPNLGTSCSTGFDDSRGQQLIIGVADAVWSCPGYEDVPGEALPRGANTCRVIRP